MINVEWKPEPAIAWLNGIAARTLDEAAKYLLAQYLVHAPEDTGYLKSTAEIEIVTEGQWIRVWVRARYAAPVEFGHIMPHGGYVPPNPALDRAVRDTAAKFPSIALSQSAIVP